MDGESLRRSIDQVRWPKRRDCWWKGSGNFIDMRAMPNLLYYMMEVHSRTPCLHEAIFPCQFVPYHLQTCMTVYDSSTLKNIKKLHTQFINKKQSSKYNSPNTFKHVLSNKKHTHKAPRVI